MEIVPDFNRVGLLYNYGQYLMSASSKYNCVNLLANWSVFFFLHLGCRLHNYIAYK